MMQYMYSYYTNSTKKNVISVCVAKPWLDTSKTKRTYLTVFTPDSLAKHAGKTGATNQR